MVVFVEQKSICPMCMNEHKFFSGMEGISIMARSVYIPLCEKCTIRVYKFMGIKGGHQLKHVLKWLSRDGRLFKQSALRKIMKRKGG